MKNTTGKLSKPSSSAGMKNTPNAAVNTAKSGNMMNTTVNFADNIDSFEVVSDGGGVPMDDANIQAALAKQAAVLDKSFIMGETNISQMIKSLGNRTENLKSKMSMAKDLLRADVELNEEGDERGAKDLPRIVNDADEEVPKSLRELRTNNATTGRDPAKMNLVTSDNVFIDPYHLVLKTKAPTDAARKIESFFQGNTNNRDTKKPNKSKTGVNADHAKKEEQVKNNSKRINRLRLERKLQQITESFVTRNVNDKVFQIPDFVDEDPKWVVSVKWSSKDPRSVLPENADGEFDPDLLLRYALEMIELPSGRKLFAWLIKQLVIQSYFVLLFWMIKVKFFETEMVDEKEVYLLHKLSREYRKLVEMLASRSHAEHEKDFVFKFLPFILSNAVFYAFFYLFPGSRHSTNTKAFKKTVYMQVVQIMHGFQVCPISVKVSWAKLFPEDAHDSNNDAGNNNGAGSGSGNNGDDNDEGKEIFPVPFAVKLSRFEVLEKEQALQHQRNMLLTASSAPSSPDTANMNTSRRSKSGIWAQSRPVTGGGDPLSPSSWMGGEEDDHSEGAFSSPGLMSRSRSALLAGAAAAGKAKRGILANNNLHNSSNLMSDSMSLGEQSNTPSLVKRFVPEALSPANNVKGAPLRFIPKTGNSSSTNNLPKLTRSMTRRGSIGDFSRQMSLSGGSLQEGNNLQKAGFKHGGGSGSLADDDDDELEEIDPFSEENITQTLAALKQKPMLQRKPSVAKLAMQRSMSTMKMPPPTNTNTNNNMNNGTTVTDTLPSAALNTTATGTNLDDTPTNNAAARRPSSSSTSSGVHNQTNNLSNGIASEDFQHNSHLLTTKNLAENPRFLRPLAKTNLKPAPLKPSNINSVKRQGVVDRISAQQVSPQMALLLSQLKDGPVDSNTNFSQTVRRTIPVNWCPAGGTDTHHRTVIATEMHHEIAEKMVKSREEFKHSGSLAHHRKIKINENLNKELAKILRGGQTMISRYSLDLIRQHKLIRANGGAPPVATNPQNISSMNPKDALQAEIEEMTMAELEKLAAYDDDDIERFLASC